MAGKRLTEKQISNIKKLRKRGYSLPEISDSLTIPKTTVFGHIQDVQIDSRYLTEWLVKRGGSRKIKLQKEKKAMKEGDKLVKKLSKKEKMLFISALYWAEGSKNDFSLSNTDPYLIKVFVEGMKEVFGVKTQEFRLNVRIYEDLDKEKCIAFWSQITNIPKEQFVSVNVLKGKKIGKLEYGMVRIRITKGGDLLKKIVGINKAVYNKISL